VVGYSEHGNEFLGFHEMLGISRVTKQLVASQGLTSMGSVS
jgi:hypothetical protein